MFWNLTKKRVFIKKKNRFQEYIRNKYEKYKTILIKRENNKFIKKNLKKENSDQEILF